jgi:HAD superfamily hydrolase (TIGR01450 family)
LKPATWAELRAAAGRAEAVLCDWDGCLAVDEQLHPGSIAFLRHVGRIAIVSNNSRMTRAECRARLAAEGVAIAPDHIHLAGDTLLREAARQFAGGSVCLIASPGMRREAEHFGLRLRERDAEAVLLLYDPAFDYTMLRRAANLVRDGAAYWVANPDASHPSRNGVMPETGALAAAITAAGGRQPDRIIGKPQPLLFNRALAMLGVSASEVLMIGDNPATDLAGAEAAAMRGLLVGSTTWAPG